ncbi:hypothetical protein YPPY66_2206, partial [Yersinia pestis PY-66]
MTTSSRYNVVSGIVVDVEGGGRLPPKIVKGISDGNNIEPYI